MRTYCPQHVLCYSGSLVYMYIVSCLFDKFGAKRAGMLLCRHHVPSFDYIYIFYIVLSISTMYWNEHEFFHNTILFITHENSDSF